MAIVGHFIWRSNCKGEGCPEKLLNDHRLGALNNSNKDVGHFYRHNLLQETPLNESQWQVSLEELAKQFPCPKIVTDLPNGQGVVRRDYYGTI